MLALALSIASPIVGVCSVFLTLATFFCPNLFQALALRCPRQWRSVPMRSDGVETYRHAILSGFTIHVEANDTDFDSSFFEHWMRVLHRPDPEVRLFDVTLYFNGLALERVSFLQYDGGRSIIPLPDFEREGAVRYVRFGRLQQQLARIVGRDHLGRTFSEVERDVLSSQYDSGVIEFIGGDLSEALSEIDRKISLVKDKYAAD